MKLYARVSSDRSQKGQGGNEYIDIDLTVLIDGEITDFERFTLRECENEKGEEGFGLFSRKDGLMKFLAKGK